jgi:hypothetical protein
VDAAYYFRRVNTSSSLEGGLLDEGFVWAGKLIHGSLLFYFRRAVADLRGPSVSLAILRTNEAAGENLCANPTGTF